MNDDWEMRYYVLTRERIGFTYDANLLTSDTTSIFLRAFYNELKILKHFNFNLNTYER